MSLLLFLIQMAVTIVVGVYFYRQLKKDKQAQPGLRRESAREMEQLRKLRAIKLSEPLSEHVRPQRFQDIVGQQEGIKSLRAILCGANPQHVIIYGPPGIGKTCAARLVLEDRRVSFDSAYYNPDDTAVPATSMIFSKAACRLISA